MSFVLTNIVLPVLMAICIGLPLSIYAGFICGRIVIFCEIQNRINEIVMANSGPFDDSKQIRNAIRSIETLSVISQRLDDQGNSSFGNSIYEIETQMKKALGELESQFVYSETRMKSDPPSAIVSNEQCRDWYSLVENARPSLKYILSWKPIA